MDSKMDSIRKFVHGEFKSTEQRILTGIMEIYGDGNRTSAQRNMKLRFKNGICRPIFTGDKIKGEGKIPLEVVLVDESTGNIVDIGPESSATVEVLLLKGESNASEGDDWTIEQFNENIVRDVEGKMSLLGGNKLLKLQNGIGFLENINFRHHAAKMKPSLFQLGVRAVDTFEGVHIKEARTESFVVKDFRNKYYIKYKTPSLNDKVYRLVNIGKGGKIEERLKKDHNICTVEDFLVRLLIDPEGLKTIVNLGEKKWKQTVENAQACPSDTRMYSYMNKQKTMGVVFNVLGQITGLYMERQYTPTNMLSEKHKADAEELLESAYKHWEKVESFDDENSLQLYFNGHENAGTSEMVGESSSRSNFSFSAMHSISESGVEDFSSFGTDDVEITHDAFLQLSPFSLDFDTLFPGFDEFLNQNDNRDTQLIIESNADEFVESMDVQISSKQARRWRKLFFVLKWFSIGKTVSVDSIHNRKKQKVGQTWRL